METILHSAVENHDVELISDLLINDLVVENYLDSVNAKNYTPLQLALQVEDISILKLLIKAGAFVDVTDAEGNFLLHVATLCKESEEIQKLLIKAGANVNAKNDHGDTPLFWAVRAENENLFRLLINFGADVYAKNKNFENILHWAARSQNVDICELLITAGVDVNARNNKGDTPVHIAVESENITVLSVLLKTQADVNAKNDQGNTPVHSAVKVKNVIILNMLLQANADVNTKNCDGSSLLYEAVESTLSTASFLLNAARANVCVVDYIGNTPLHLAASTTGDINILKMLLNAGANESEPNYEGNTPLHLAAKAGNLENLKLLIDAGADVTRTDYEGNTLLHKAVDSSNISVVKFLVEAGHNIDTINSAGHTPLILTSLLCSFNVFKYLLQVGSNVNLNQFNEWNPLTLFIENLKTYKGENYRKVEEILRMLVESTDINHKDKYGFNMLMQYLKSDSSELWRSKNFIWSIIIQHIATLKIIDLPVDSSLLEIIFNDSYNYKPFFEECTEELKKMKNTKIDNSWLTFFNLLVDNKSNFVKYGGNKELITNFEKNVHKFPIYKKWLRSNVYSGVNDRESFDEAAAVLSSYLPLLNPAHLIIRDTLETLNIHEWEDLAVNLM